MRASVGVKKQRSVVAGRAAFGAVGVGVAGLVVADIHVDGISIATTTSVPGHVRPKTNRAVTADIPHVVHPGPVLVQLLVERGLMVHTAAGHEAQRRNDHNEKRETGSIHRQSSLKGWFRITIELCILYHIGIYCQWVYEWFVCGFKPRYYY